VAGPRLTINHQHHDWDAGLTDLPETVLVNGSSVSTLKLDQEAKRLLAIYLVDQRIVGQQEELLSLAKIGLVEIGNRILNSLK